MLLQIPDVLTANQVADCRGILARAPWVDGKVTAGHQSALAKNNRQLPEDSEAARRLGDFVLSALGRNPLFISAALPLKVFPPLFNSYGGGQSFGSHVDNAIRHFPGSVQRLRTDLSMTLFLAEPEEYEGGELVVEDHFGTHEVKLPAGHAVLYPASSLHKVTAVTRGTRLASFFWVQSMVRDDQQRRHLFELDQAIQQLGQRLPEDPALLRLTGIYHNLLRLWADS